MRSPAGRSLRAAKPEQAQVFDLLDAQRSLFMVQQQAALAQLAQAQNQVLL